eukprot:scaffold10070_cov109-Isochrysis_galbana.AAC.1
MHRWALAAPCAHPSSLSARVTSSNGHFGKWESSDTPREWRREVGVDCCWQQHPTCIFDQAKVRVRGRNFYTI